MAGIRLSKYFFFPLCISVITQSIRCDTASLWIILFSGGRWSNQSVLNFPEYLGSKTSKHMKEYESSSTGWESIRWCSNGNETNISPFLTGVPVFSAFRGGLGVMLGYTGGFLWGFLPLTVLCAWGTVLRNKTAAVFTGMIGMLLCHVSGVLQYAVITGSGIMQSVFLVSAPYILKDVVCVAAGYFAANAVQRALRAAGLKNE